MKILHVVPSLCVGGMEMLTISLAGAMRELGHDAQLIALDGVDQLDETARDFGVPLHHVHSRGWRTLLTPSPLSAYLREAGPDVVHSHNGAWGRTVTASRIAGVPIRAHTMHGFHERDAAKMRWIERVCVTQTETIVAVSDELRHEAVRRLWAPARRVQVIRNGIRMPDGQAPVSRASLGLDDSHLVVITVGRLVPVKAHLNLVRAFGIVSAAIPNARLAIAGEGPERATLERAIHDGGLARSVQLLGERHDVAGLLAMADCYCLPSLSEGLSISLLEAMAARLPVVASAVGATPELVTPDIGILVPPGDADALGRGLLTILSAPAGLPVRGERARARVESSFTIRSTAHAYLSAYAQAR